MRILAHLAAGAGQSRGGVVVGSVGCTFKLGASLLVSACAAAPSAAPPNASPSEKLVPPSPGLRVEPLALPGATPPVSLDFLFYEAGRGRVWIPAGGTGDVDVFDTATRTFTRISGFGTVEREGHGKKRVVGPSSGDVGNGVAYIGNRATSEICAVDLETLDKRSCVKLADSPDCVQYVASTQEVWVTTPASQSVVILDAAPQAELRQKATVSVPGAPEGYALDAMAGVFLTNLEDKGSTLRIDLKTHQIRDTWAPGCSADGPRGVAVDAARRLVMVACTDHVQVLDAAHGGAPLGRLETGAGVDNITYVASHRLLFVAAGKAARLTVATIEDGGQPSVVATTDTAPGARNAVVDAQGNAYLADPQAARLLFVPAVDLLSR